MATCSNQSALFAMIASFFVSSCLADEEAVYPGEIVWGSSGRIYGRVDRVDSPRFTQPSGPVRIRLVATSNDPQPSLLGRSIPLRYISFLCPENAPYSCYHVYDPGTVIAADRVLAEATHVKPG